MAAQNAELRRHFIADMGTPDGVGIVLSSRLRGGRIRERVTGIDLMLELMDVAVEGKHPVFLYGAAEGVAEEAARNLQKSYPGLIIAGTHHGYVEPEEEPKIAELIARSGAEMVFVGTGSPRQEMFAARYGEATGAKVLMVVGGSFDVLSGRLQRAPKICQQLGLEWLYRSASSRGACSGRWYYRILLYRSGTGGCIKYRNQTPPWRIKNKICIRFGSITVKWQIKRFINGPAL